MSEEASCELSEVESSTVEGFHVPEISGAQVQLAIFFTSYWPIIDCLIETGQRESIVRRRKILVRETLQNLYRSFIVHICFLQFEYSCENSLILWITKSFAFCTCQ